MKRVIRFGRPKLIVEPDLPWPDFERDPIAELTRPLSAKMQPVRLTRAARDDEEPRE